MLLVHSTKLFWPADRKLFRQRSRVRRVVPLLAVAMALGIAYAFGRTPWS